MDIKQIKKAIPHREPFLWVDEVLELDDQHIHGTKFLSPDLDIFAGHYPDFPILPGVLQCEMCFQASAILIARTMEVKPGYVPVVTRANDIKFRKMVRPGDTANIHVEIKEVIANAYILAGKIVVDGNVTTRLEFVTSAAPIE